MSFVHIRVYGGQLLKAGVPKTRYQRKCQGISNAEYSGGPSKLCSAHTDSPPKNDETPKKNPVPRHIYHITVI